MGDSFSAAEIEAFRQDTPLVVAGRAHLNNAGASPSPEPVLEAMREYQEYESLHGGYESAAARAEQIRGVYGSVASLLGTQAKNIALVENATVGFSQSLSAFDWSPGDVIVTTRNDYVSNYLHFLSLERRCGIKLIVAPDRLEGGVDPDGLAELASEHRAKLVTLTWMPTNSGLLQPAAEVGQRCQQIGVPYLVDACQVVGQQPIDVGALGCDFLSATGRKFLRGPRGTGVLFVSDQMLEAGRYPLYLDLHGADWTDEREFVLQPDARRFENWEFNQSLLVGLGAAAEYAASIGLARIARRSADLAARTRRAAADRGLRVLDEGEDLGAIVTLDVGSHDGGALVDVLRQQKINTSSMDRTSAVLDLDAKGAQQVVRVSPHYFNTEAEIDRCIEALATALPAG